MKGVFRVKEQKKISLESLVSEIEKNGRIGRLGKVFKTEKNYYFYDTGTGKVAKLNSNVYIVLKSLLEGMPVEEAMMMVVFIVAVAVVAKESIVQVTE